jgi:ribosomal protein S24E
MNIIVDRKNGLLKRREVKLILESESNPGYERSVQIISEQFKAKPENIAMQNVKSKFGRNTFLIDAYIYDSEKDKLATEPKPKEKKK